jgi:hypothetical protein
MAKLARLTLLGRTRSILLVVSSRQMGDDCVTAAAAGGYGYDARRCGQEKGRAPVVAIVRAEGVCRCT